MRGKKSSAPAMLLMAVLLLFGGCQGQGSNVPSTASPSPSGGPDPVLEQKASSLLLMQMDLRQQQVANPEAGRLSQMQQMGMSIEPIDRQRVFIYLAQEPTALQVEDMEALGIEIDPGSWIPPVGNHPDGFVPATVPVDSLAGLAGKDYVIRLDSAERQLTPQDGLQPGGGEIVPKLVPVPSEGPAE